MIPVYNNEEISRMRESGKILASCFEMIEQELGEGVTPQQIDSLVYNFLEEADALPAFLGYRGYPASICASVNEVVIHGIPDDRPLEAGDIIGIDIGALYKGYHADMTRTFSIGDIDETSRKLIEVTKEALYRGIRNAKDGNRTGHIAHAIQTHVEKAGFSVVRDFIGHGIGTKLHQEPPVPNYGNPAEGPVLKEGMTIAIEPMVNAGTYKVKVLENQWTTVTRDGKRSAHFEHTVAVGKKGGRILTSVRD